MQLIDAMHMSLQLLRFPSSAPPYIPLLSCSHSIHTNVEIDTHVITYNSDKRFVADIEQAVNSPAHLSLFLLHLRIHFQL
jgi:hypothetical protein